MTCFIRRGPACVVVVYEYMVCGGVVVAGLIFHQTQTRQGRICVASTHVECCEF